MLAALGWNLSGWVLLATGAAGAQTLGRLGWIGLGQSLLGLAFCGAVLLVCFVFLEVGGGDVKLMAMIGAFLGWQDGLTAMLWTFILGACAAIVVLIWRVGPWRLATRVARQALWTVRLGSWSPLTAEERAELKPPLFLTPCALVAVVIVRFTPLALV
jgi:prepilin peptidase CpaA